MTTGKIIELIKGICEAQCMPYAYDHFDSEQKLPFCAYHYVESNNFNADNKIALRKGQFNVELYTQKKTPALEKLFEDKFDEVNAPYRKYESFLNDEKMYEVL